MAFVATIKKINGSATAHSVGPVAVEYYDFSAISGDVSGTIASNLRSISHVELVGGVVQTALPTISGSTITLAFTNPLASVFGHAKVYGTK